jgi:prevent-host-death family protein
LTWSVKHLTFGFLEKFLISEFKARCIELLKQVHNSGRPIIVTLRGEPLVQVIPVTKSGQPRIRLGRKHGNAVFKGDVVHFAFSKEWEANR